MITSRRVMALLGAVTVVGLVGCAPGPAPEPSPTPAFASEDEAFAAAEEVYRAYTEALNNIDPADPHTFEPMYELSTGDFEADDKETFSRMHAEKHQITGGASVLSFTGTEARPPYKSVEGIICLDVSSVEITNEHGESLVNPNRPDVYAISARFERVNDELLISTVDALEGHSCAGS